MPTANLAAYDPSTQTWATRAPMPTPRSHFAAAAAGGYLYAIGGIGVGTVERYDPVADSWTAVAPSPRRDLDSRLPP